MGTISVMLVFFPLMVLIASAALAGNSNLAGSTSSVSICNPNSPPNCLSGGSTGFSCPAQSQLFFIPCVLRDSAGKNLVCPKLPPPPSYCFTDLTGTTLWLLPAGGSVVIPNAQIISTASGVLFGFGTVGNSGFISVIGIAVGLVCLAGITVFGTGSSFEGVHILFIGGAMMGLWLFLSGLDGFLTGSAASMFTQMNSSVISMGGPPIGTSLYVMLTFLYFIGFISMVKRG